MRRRQHVADEMPEGLREFRESDWQGGPLEAIGSYKSAKRAWLEERGLGLVDLFVEVVALRRVVFDRMAATAARSAGALAVAPGPATGGAQ